jgi:hypothetical protein
VAYSPDGTRILSISHDKTVRIWEASTGDQLSVLEGHNTLFTFGLHWGNAKVAVAPAPSLLRRTSDAALEPGTNWYVRPSSGGQFGPATMEVFRRWMVEGDVSSDSLIWREGWPDWKLAGQAFPDFFRAPESPRSGSRQGASGLPSTVGQTTEKTPSVGKSTADEAFSSHTIVVRYPTPIAIAYRRFVRQADAPTRLRMLFSTFEATVRYLVTIGVAELFHELASQSGRKPELPEHEAFNFLRRKTPMTLGMWVSALREVGRELARQPLRFVPDLAECCGPESEFSTKSAEWLVNKRNDCFHEDGSLALTPDECRQVVREARPRLETAIQQVEFVCGYPLGFAQQSAGFAGDQGRFTYQIHSCMGARVDDTALAFVIRTSQALQEQVPFIVAPDGSRLMYLWPLLHERVAVHTGRHSLYVFEQIPDRRRPFLVDVELAAIDFRDSWPRQLSELPATSHAWLVDRLKKIPAVQHLSTESRSAETHIAARLLPKRGGKLVGKMLGSYRLKAVIAEGGFGTIYSAESARHSVVAVKVIETPDSVRYFKRFREEVKRLRQAAASPHIIQHLDDGIDLVDDREYPWYAMEFAAGGDLSDRIVERRRVGREVIPWKDPHSHAAIIAEFRSILAGVAHLHQLGIIHRDIKPGNVLILDNGDLRLSDFGLAKHLNPAGQSLLLAPRTSTGAVLGTRDYMAPEQERGEDVEKSADVYALGILLAELACGKRPQPNLYVKKGSTLSGFRPLNALPPALRKFVHCCTNVSPSLRFPDAVRAREEFERLASV